MRGTGYAVLEIIWWMLAAGIVGFLIGWLLRRWLPGRRVTEEWESKLHAARGRVDGLSAELRKRDATIRGLRLSVDGATGEISDLKDVLRVRSEELTAATTATASFEAKLGAANQELMGLADLQATLTQRDGRVAELESLVEGREAKFATVESDLANARASIGRLEAELATARSEAEQVETGRGRIVELESAIGERDQRIRDLEATSADRENRVAELESTLAGRDARISELEDVGSARARELDDLAARLRACEERPAAVAAPVPSEPTVEELPDRESATAQMAEIAARTRGTGPVVDDDLKLIHGVGPKLEGLLKTLGITSFRQVANFGHDDIRYVTAALDAFPGRIERDDWMSSAAEQHRTKYGENV